MRRPAPISNAQPNSKVSRLLPISGPSYPAVRIRPPSRLSDCPQTQFTTRNVKVSAEFWPDAPIIPTMGAGASDGSYLRNAGIPTYGHSGLAGDVDDVRVHGKDERALVKSFFDGQEYLYRLVKMLSGG